MQTVSEKWKTAHRQTLLNESYVEVSLDIADPEALADAALQGAHDNGAIYISDSSEVANRIDKPPTPYCTLEQNMWLLNGGRKALPETNVRNEGYIGDTLSDATCVFSEKIPTLTISFSKKFSNLIPGVTITWSNTYGEYATDFIVRAYDGDKMIAEKEVNNNHSIKSVVMVDIVNYNRIIIYMKKWCLPYHRPRVEEVFVGMNRVYYKTDLFNYSHKQSVSPVSTSLPKNEIQFSIGNIGGEYNPYNEQGMAKYLIERQEVKAKYGLKLNDGTVEWIKGGTFYLSDWYAKQNGLTADFTARDLLEFMSAIYEDAHNLSRRSLYDLAKLVLNAANLPINNDGTVKWYIDESLKSKYSTAPLPQDTLANCLQLIANAGECVIYQDRDGILRIEQLPSDYTDYSIRPSNSYSKSEISLTKPIKQIDVKLYAYGMRLDEEGDEVGYESNSIVMTTTVGQSGEIITVDNPLITDMPMAESVGAWMATHLGHRMTLDSSWRADVRLDALDIVTNENEYNTNRVRMTDVEFKYNGAFRGTGEGKVI